MSQQQKQTIENWPALILGLLAIFSLRSLFDNDESKIVSKEGRKYLADDEKMREISEKIAQSKDEDIFI